LTIPEFADFKYPDRVKLKPKGCQNIPIEYVTDDNLSRENTVFLVAITSKTTKQAYGYAAWFSKQTALGENALPPMARIGVLQIKVCRTPFKYSKNATKMTPGIKPGIYRIFFDAGTTDAQTGEVSKDKIEIIRYINMY
jgi:hypothetical protein